MQARRLQSLLSRLSLPLSSPRILCKACSAVVVAHVELQEAEVEVVEVDSFRAVERTSRVGRGLSWRSSWRSCREHWY